MTSRSRALRCDTLAPDLQGLALTEIDVPPPGPKQILLRVRAAALNFPDVLMTEGKYQYKPPMPFIPGTEGAGEVIACGAEVSTCKPGDHLAFHRRSGAIAEQVLLDEADVAPMPRGFSYAQAAGWHVGAITAYTGLVIRGQLQPGETALIHGASGGMGIPAVQLAAHLGAQVIATGTSDEKLEVVKAAGAHHVLNLRHGFREQVKALTSGHGADVIYDPVGGDVFDESVRCINWGGRLVIIGFAGGRIPTVPVNMPLIKGFSVVGCRAGEEVRRNPVRGAQTLRTLKQLADDGLFKPHVGATYSLDQSIDALRSLIERRHAGKVVVLL